MRIGVAVKALPSQRTCGPEVPGGTRSAQMRLLFILKLAIPLAGNGMEGSLYSF
jgi:hypothetical protein